MINKFDENIVVNIYLNHNSAATRFYYHKRIPRENKNDYIESHILDITPEPGLALIFRQLPYAELLHTGLQVTNGNKYLMRTDIMYQKI